MGDGFGLDGSSECFSRKVKTPDLVRRSYRHSGNEECASLLLPDKIISMQWRSSSWLFTIEEKRVDRRFTVIFRRKEKTAVTGIREPCEAPNGAIELLGEIARFP